MILPSDLRYTSDHEWVRREDGHFVVGVTDFAQASMGDVVHVDQPLVGAVVAKGDALIEIETTKSVSVLYAPVAGVVTASNDSVFLDPALINAEPYERGWIVSLAPSDPADYDHLLTPDSYASLIDAIEP